MFPAVEVWQVRWTALAPQRLPGLVTTALHGALDDALYGLCDEAGDLGPYTALLHPPAGGDAGPGVTNQAPAPVVIAPLAYDPAAPWSALAEGAEVGVRVTLVGDYAASQKGLLLEALWRAMCRRAALLQRCHGTSSTTAAEYPQEAPFAVVTSDTRSVAVTRWSDRQGARMTWPGVVGALTLQGERLPEAVRLLGFVEAVQWGKHTGFGFGRVRFAA